jgi:phage terminase large subunit-like protein
MNKNKIYKLSKILNEIKKRNIEPLSKYNTGKIKHEKQLMFHKSLKRNRWVFGGNRTGKTECGAVETIWLSLGIHPFRPNKTQTECWVVSLSTRVQKEVAQSKILKYLPTSSIIDIVMNEGKKSSPSMGVIECILVKNVSGKSSKIWFKSCEEGREKFQGASLDFVWFDEEPPEDIYRECKMRVLDKCGEIFGTMTPLKGFTFIYDEIYLNSSNDSEVFCEFMSWEDNPYLNKKEIERLTASMPSEEIESRKNGKFTSIDMGLIYPEFDVNIHVISPFDIPKDWQDTISIDPGLSNPLSCHWYARDYDGNVYVVAEHFADNKTIEYHAEKIKEISKTLNWKTASNGMVEALIDSAANQKTLSSQKSVTELFYCNGILCNPNVNKNVLAGISKVKTYLKNIAGQTKLFIFANCTNLIREMKTYRWSGSDSPLKKDDHSLDELRYYIMNISSEKTELQTKTAIQKDKERLIRLMKRNYG